MRSCGGGGTKCPDPFNIAIGIFLFSWKRVFLSFDCYFFGVRQFLERKNVIFYPTFCARNCTFFAQIASFLQGPEGSLRRAGLGLGQGAQTQVGSPSLGLLGLPNLAPF